MNRISRMKGWLKKSPSFYRLASWGMRSFRKIHRLLCPHVKVINRGLKVSLEKDCLGFGNTIYIMGGGGYY